MYLAERALISSPLANHNENKQRSEPIRARRRNKQPAALAGKRVNLTDV